MSRKDFELLAPAGSFETFKAVIEAGADAVYVGGDRFGARAYANNFDKEQLLSAIDYAHVRGRKVFLTVNTLLKNKEIESLYEYLLPFYQAGLDAVLVQDFGALNYIHKAFPDMPIHTSTQMTVTGVDGAMFLKEYGVERIVMAREVSLEEMKEIHAATGLEIEAFVHGALCYSYSGQCLFSSMLGGRSGNRGRCAQPCRLPYKVLDSTKNKVMDDSYILSLKDMCGIKDLSQLKDAGVYSLKIEGRMKQPEYAAGVVSMYRKYIDSLEKVSNSDYATLEDIGNRCGFSNSYYYMHNDSSMITGIKPSFNSNNSGIYDSIASKYLNTSSKLMITGKAKVIEEEPVEFELVCGEYVARAIGNPALAAKNKPMTKEDISGRLAKMGDTPFEIDNIEVQISENVFVPNGALNQLRRDAVKLLEDKILSKYRRNSSNRISLTDYNVDNEADINNRKIASVEYRYQLDVVAGEDIFTDIYIDSNAYSCKDFSKELEVDIKKVTDNGKDGYLVLPAIYRKETKEKFDKELNKADLSKLTGFVIKNYEELKIIKKKFIDKKIIIDHNMYTYNDFAVRAFIESGVDGITVPVELNSKEIMNRDNSLSEIIIYGYYPLMTTAGCVHKNSTACDKKPQLLYLRDRYNKDFPVKNNCNVCYNTIYNSLPTMLFKQEKILAKNGINSFRFNFTIESQEEIKNIINIYKHGDMIKSSIESTNGHYKRGVE